MNILNKDYKGNALQQPMPQREYALPEKDFRGEKTTAGEIKTVIEEIAPYFSSPELIEVVRYARVLKRPLLIMGDPGTGKTRLAQAVAYEMYLENYRQKYFEWFIKSTSKVTEGLYSFDHLSRLRDSQANQLKHDYAYRSFGPLGQAFLNSKKDEPSVLLIDEIDKADIDFPNDLLLELDQNRFYIPDTKEYIVAQEAPLIIITSNDEKDLPNAFLRRCVFHYIDFPGDEQLFKIAKAHAYKLFKEYGERFQLGDDVLDAVVKRFKQLYVDMKGDSNTTKMPSTSELLDWIRLVHVQSLEKPMQPDDFKTRLPFPEVLLKSIDDFNVQVKNSKRTA